MIQFKLNGKPQSYDGDAAMPLLWYVRDIAGLSGTKFGVVWACVGRARCIVTVQPRGRVRLQ